MEAVQARVRGAITKMMEDLDRDCLRQIQIDMHRCSVTCCQDRSYKMDDVKRCIDRCSAPLNQADKYIQKEIMSFQGRLQDCAVDCQSQVRDRDGPPLTGASAAKHRIAEFEQCLTKCGDTSINLLPALFAQMKTIIKQTASEEAGNDKSR